MKQYFDKLSSIWHWLRNGRMVGATVVASDGNRHVALDIQKEMIEAGANCRVQSAENVTLDDVNLIEVDDNTLIVITEYAGGLLGGPNFHVYTFTYLGDTKNA